MSDVTYDMPQKKDITFVVCGKIGEVGRFRTARGLMSIRKFFPESKIILSTWEKEPIEELEGLYDQIVLSDGSAYPVKFPSLLNDKDRINTVNIQQITGFAGMRCVDTKWAVKTRTDFVFWGDRFFHFYREWEPTLNKYDSKYRFVKRRVLAPWLFTENPELKSVSYMLSDFFQFGLTEDLKQFWDGHQEPDADLNFYATQTDGTFSNPEHYNHRFNVEQMFFRNVIKKTEMPVWLPRWYCDDGIREHLSELKTLYASNVLLGTLFELQLETRWQEEEPIFNTKKFISLQTLLQWYLKYVEPNNEKCVQYLKSNPTPMVGKWTLSRRLRMSLRQITWLRTLYRYWHRRYEQFWLKKQKRVRR